MKYTVYKRYDAFNGPVDKLSDEDIEKVLTEDGVKALRLFVLSQKQDAYKGVMFNVCELTGAHGFCEEKVCESCEGFQTLWVKRHWGF